MSLPPELTPSQISEFQSTILDFYDKNQRTLPWREPQNIDPYKILVSEIMLQQTQVSRVAVKYPEFLHEFPTLSTLAEASFGSVLKIWSGLGYNRRAKYLHDASKQLIHFRVFPKTIEELVTLPGIGINTASAVLVYSFNQRLIFIETNIRTVFIHHFFDGEDKVHDREIRSLVEQTLPFTDCRRWYWALMDYGSYLKSQGNNISQSKHYTRQSTFKGSKRQLRGIILRHLLDGRKTFVELQTVITDERLREILEVLVSEGLVNKSGNNFTITG